MADCPHYEIYSSVTRRKAITNPSRKVFRAQRNEVPYCAHPKHSPVTREDTKGVLGGGNIKIHE